MNPTNPLSETHQQRQDREQAGRDARLGAAREKAGKKQDENKSKNQNETGKGKAQHQQKSGHKKAEAVEA